MTPTNYILAGICLALFTGILGMIFGKRAAVTESECDERRVSCNKLVEEKLKVVEVKMDNYESKLDGFDKKLDLILTEVKNGK